MLSVGGRRLPAVSATVALEFYAKVEERNLRPAVETIRLELPQPEWGASGNSMETSQPAKNVERPARNGVSSRQAAT